MKYLLLIALLGFSADAFAGVDCIVKGKGFKGKERFIVTADSIASVVDKLDREVKNKGLTKARAVCSSSEYNFEISVRKK